MVEKSDGTKRSFMIVGSAESDMNSGKISNRSPLGAAVLGKKKGDSFSFSSPMGVMAYKVIEVK
ncbi:MAG: GreA/GreB family elongation factor [Candidatus Paceibacterota bacterium]